MAEDREKEDTTESTERIPPGSGPPEESETAADRDKRKKSDKVDQESEDSFPASDPPAW